MKTATSVVSDDQLAIEMKKACFHWPSDHENHDQKKSASNAYSNPVAEEENDFETNPVSTVSNPSGTFLFGFLAMSVFKPDLSRAKG